MSGTRSSALVTGGAGFIGSHVTDKLLAAGWNVKVLDNFSTGKRENLPDIEIIEGAIQHPDTVWRAMRDVDVVFHLAALPSIPRSISHPLVTHDVNVTGTLTVLQCATEIGVRRVVYSSSSSVYGNSGLAIPKREVMPVHPLSPYALQKYIGEQYCQLFTQLYGLETVPLRYFNVYGPRQNAQGNYAAVIPRFIHAALMGIQPTIYGDGNQTRDFTYVSDVAEANLLAATSTVSAKVFNIAGGGSTSVNDLWNSVQQLVGSNIIPKHLSTRNGEVRDSLADLSSAQEVLGYAPKFSLMEGLKLTIEREQLWRATA